jgi:putative intracellular protease/amidase
MQPKPKKAPWRTSIKRAAIAAISVLAACSQPTDSLESSEDFDVALRGVNFDIATLDANLADGQTGDGLLDADQLALVWHVLQTPEIDFSATGGVKSETARQAYTEALEAARSDMSFLNITYPTAAQMVAGYAMLGKASRESMGIMTAAFGAPLKSEYPLADKVGELFSAAGDADGDGTSNGDEYRAVISGGRAAYIKAALDPDIRDGKPAAPVSADTNRTLTVGIVLYPGFEVLDVFGPVEMWSYVPGLKVVMVAETAGSVASANQGISTVADVAFADAPQFDILMVPGGAGTYQQLQNEVFLEFLRTQDKGTTYTTSVCTGSALLAKAGLLSGRKATSNKAVFSLAVEQDASVQWQKDARWVEDGKYFTSSGVSAGTDMALGLVSRMKSQEEAAQLAKSLEYIWNADPNNDPFAIE